MTGVGVAGAGVDATEEGKGAEVEDAAEGVLTVAALPLAEPARPPLANDSRASLTMLKMSFRSSASMACAGARSSSSGSEFGEVDLEAVGEADRLINRLARRTVDYADEEAKKKDSIPVVFFTIYYPYGVIN